jgi:hypothetical protein
MLISLLVERHEFSELGKAEVSGRENIATLKCRHGVVLLAKIGGRGLVLDFGFWIKREDLGRSVNPKFKI